MPVFIGVSACAPAADCAPGSVERARPVAAILSAVAVERHAGAVGMGARSNVTPSPPGKIVTPSPLASRARERHAVVAFILSTWPGACSSCRRRRHGRRVDRQAVAGKIGTPANVSPPLAGARRERVPGGKSKAAGVRG